MSTKTITAWTRQVAQVQDEIEQTGTYRVREEYVREKNGSISDYYLELYRWLTEGCRSRMDIPADAKYPVWLALTQAQKLGPAPGTITLTLEIPEDKIFILDYDRWGYRVNDMYIPLNDADEDKHNKELLAQGISNESLLFRTDKGNFYPALKSKISRSWQRVFEPSDQDLDHCVGVVWEILPEWITEVEIHEQS